MENPEAPVFLHSSSGTVMGGRPALLGCPMDETSTYRSGSARGPDAIRRASDSIETYSPFLDRDLGDHPFADLGDLSFNHGDVNHFLERLRLEAISILRAGGRPFLLGGEHTITLPLVRALRSFHHGLVVLHVDAHADLRESYEGDFVNHATVMRRVSELVGSGNIVQLGIRAGTKDEFLWMRSRSTLLRWGPSGDKALIGKIGDRPVHLTFDLDVLDPAALPGTGNPEAGGWTYSDFERLLCALDRLNLVSADVVELNPLLDPSGASSITAAKIVRELLLVLGNP